MTTVKKLVLAMIVLPLTLASTGVFANNGKEHDKQGHKEFILDRGLMRELDLTQEQQAQLKDLREAMKKDLKAQYQENFAVHQEEKQAHKEKMQALVLADSFDKAAANELAKAMLENQAEHKVKLLEKQHQLLSILTPEQKTKYIEMQKERDAQRAQKRQERLTKS
ncbi:CpxP family protein [Vibrio pectenicida]|uniref:CpxP family protein n=1 Tax=Vibrio pectenicida TaxID=62763 RepID=A0A7Y3ZXV3_9VIBR|nr:CpxP family protein [Vibrio pectenicida]NOH70801.1 CpxP family protein [Vibrio pectenicida]